MFRNADSLAASAADSILRVRNMLATLLDSKTEQTPAVPVPPIVIPLESNDDSATIHSAISSSVNTPTIEARRIITNDYANTYASDPNLHSTPPVSSGTHLLRFKIVFIVISIHKKKTFFSFK